MRILCASLALIALPLAALAGDKPGDLLKEASGTYAGYVKLQSSSGTLRSVKVTADLEDAEHHEFSLKLESEDRLQSWEFLVKQDGKGVRIEDSRNEFEPLELKTPNASCFDDERSGEDEGSQLCFTDQGIRIERQGAPAAGVRSIELQRRDASVSPALERPRPYSLAELIQRAKTDNFDNRIEFERYVQAKLYARNAMGNLAPHFSINTILNVASLSTLTVLKSIGDLAPFLFPTRWLDAKAKQWESKAAAQAVFSMRADSIQIVQGLAYSIVRDRDGLRILEANRAKTQQIRDLMIQREHAGQLPIGASDPISAILITIDQAKETLNQAIATELAALAQAEGFDNPEAISGLEGVMAPPPVGEHPPAIEPAITLANQKSVELQQLKDLVAAAKLEKKSRIFNWLDPNGDPSGGVGIGLGAYIEIGQSKAREAELKVDQLKTILDQKVSDAVHLLSLDLSAYGFGTQGAETEDRIVNRLVKDLRMGTPFVISDLVDALQKRTQSELSATNARFDVEVGKSRIDRLTYSGVYANLGDLRSSTAAASSR